MPLKKEKKVTLFFFWLSSLVGNLYFEKTAEALVLGSFSFSLLLLFLPMDYFFFILLVARILVFHTWGLALFLFLQIISLFLLKEFGLRKEIWLFYFFWIGIVYFIFNKETLMIAPISGALAIYFFLLAKTGKDHFRSFLLFMINSFFYCFFTETVMEEKSIYFFFFILIILLNLIALTFLKLHMQKLPLSKFGEEFNLLVYESKNKFFFIVYGVLILLFYMACLKKNLEVGSSYNEQKLILFWLWAYSLVFQLGSIGLFQSIFHLKKKTKKF